MSDTTDLVARLEGLGAAVKPFADAWNSTGVSLPPNYPHSQIAAIAREKIADRDFRRAVEAINALPALLAAVREGEAEVERLRAQVHDLLHPRMSGWTEEEKADIRAHYAASQPSQPTEGSNGS